jgi:hypothetical protein
VRAEIRAAEQGWDLSPTQRAQIRDRLLAIVTPPDAGGKPAKTAHRLAISAARALTALGRLALEERKAEPPEEPYDLRTACRDTEDRIRRRRIAELEAELGRRGGATTPAAYDHAGLAALATAPPPDAEEPLEGDSAAGGASIAPPATAGNA